MGLPTRSTPSTSTSQVLLSQSRADRPLQSSHTILGFRVGATNGQAQPLSSGGPPLPVAVLEVVLVLVVLVVVVLVVVLVPSSAVPVTGALHVGGLPLSAAEATPVSASVSVSPNA